VLCSAVTAGLLGVEATLIDLGEYRLRDVSVPLRVFQVGPGAFPALRALEELPGNLRTPPTSFVGRAAELAEVVALVRAHRLVTLTGVGKAPEVIAAGRGPTRSYQVSPKRPVAWA
jgi:hypothetical protein